MVDWFLSLSTNSSEVQTRLRSEAKHRANSGRNMAPVVVPSLRKDPELRSLDVHPSKQTLLKIDRQMKSKIGHFLTVTSHFACV